ncbi:phytanoyl-CoA dioxygenase family protein [Streptomyces sp. NPDC054855]
MIPPSPRPSGPTPVRSAALHRVELTPAGYPVALRRVLSGDLVVLAGGLRHLGHLSDIERLARAAAAHRLPGSTTVEAPLDELHRYADTRAIEAIRTDLETRLRPLGRRVLHDVTAAITPRDTRPYLSEHLGIRIMPPLGTVTDHSEFASREGFLTPRHAHVDSWFNTALNSVNLWMAITPVQRGNGLILYPDAFRRPLRHDGHTLLPGQHTGDPVDLALDPGDILLFAGDHLHASQPNTTDATRFVLTKRFSAGPPRYPLRATGWVPYLDQRLLSTPLAPLAALRSRLTPAGLRQALRGRR